MSFPSLAPVSLDVTAAVLNRLSAGDRYAGFAARLASANVTSVVWNGPTLRLEVVGTPRVCCSSGGACAVVADDQCCPSGSTLLAGAFACSPQPCPQPVACCSPCGACSVLPAGAACPDGTTALSGVSACSPANPCPAAGAALSLAPAAAGLTFVGGVVNTPYPFRGDVTDGSIFEFALASVPPGATVRSARLELVPSFNVTSLNIDVQCYAGDGVVNAADYNAGTLFTTANGPVAGTQTIDVTANVRQRVAAGDQFAGFVLRFPSGGYLQWNQARLLLDIVAPKVCCDAASGVCTTVNPDQCCPSGTTLLAGVFTCSPQPCPQPPIACCSPCGACSLVPSGSSCPSGTTALSGVSSCSPGNPCAPIRTIAVTAFQESGFQTLTDPERRNTRFVTGIYNIQFGGEFALPPLPQGATLQAARVEFDFSSSTFNPVNGTALIRGRVGDGDLGVDDYVSASTLGPVPVSGLIGTRTTEATAFINDVLSSPGRYASVLIGAGDDIGSTTFTIESLRILLDVKNAPRVCCAPAAGTCTLVPADQCCPAGTNELATALTCSPNPCPTDCVVSDWSDWGPCSLPCGGGVQIRRRSVTTAAANGGQACPVLEESRPCNLEPCTVACCDPCGVCTVVQVSAGCPSGTTASMSSTCGPQTCPASSALLSALTPTGFGRLEVFYAPDADAPDFSGPITALRSQSIASNASDQRSERFIQARATPAP
ncbi:MAG: hypothetical protein K2Q20_02505, partial [Phycisphaerales bacterium]|nr:hypothetical protein [Phycisphaerales bacterium]